MAKSIHFCENCKEYTLSDLCPRCNKKTVLPKPPKYSPEDKYAAYRRQAKEELAAKDKLVVKEKLVATEDVVAKE